MPPIGIDIAQAQGPYKECRRSPYLGKYRGDDAAVRGEVVIEGESKRNARASAPIGNSPQELTRAHELKMAPSPLQLCREFIRMKNPRGSRITQVLVDVVIKHSYAERLS